MYKLKFKPHAIILVIPTLLGGSCPSYGQSHNWNMQAREQAEISNSKALTILSKGINLKGALDQAIAALLRATSADPTDPVPFTTLGLTLDLKERYSEALDALNKSYQLEPKSKETLLSIAITHYLGRTFKKSENVLNTLLRQNPDFCAAHIDLGFVYMRLGDFDKAKRQFKQAITCNPNCEPAYQGEALVDYLSGHLEDAYAEIQHAETLRPYQPATLLLAEICFLRGDHEGMNAALKRIAKVKQPFEQRPMAMIGFSPQHDFHWDPYIADDFDRAAFLSARAADFGGLGKKRASLAASGKIATEVARIEQVVATAPANDFYLLRQAGLLSLADGNYPKAAEYFDRVTKACANSHIDFLYLGQALWLGGNKVDAAKCLRIYADHFPQQRLANAFVEILKAAPEGAQPAEGGQQQPKPSTQPIDTGF